MPTPTPNVAPEDLVPQTTDPAATPSSVPAPPVVGTDTPAPPIAPPAAPVGQAFDWTTAATNPYQPNNKQGIAVTADQVSLSGDVAKMASQLGIDQDQVVNLRKQLLVNQGYNGAVADDGSIGKLENESLTERSSLPTTGAPIGTAGSYFDQSRGVTVNAAPGSHFELYAGGGVKPVKGNSAAPLTGAPASSLFNQGTMADPNGGPNPIAVPGFTKDTLAVPAIAGKTVVQTGQTVFDPVSKTDINAPAGKTYIVYDDGTVEARPTNAMGTPTIARDLSTFAPAPAAGKKQPLPYSGLEYIGATYHAANGEVRTAVKGEAYYQDPLTGNIVSRPDKGQANSLQSTSPSVLASRAAATSTTTPTGPQTKQDVIKSINDDLNSGQSSDASKLGAPGTDLNDAGSIADLLAAKAPSPVSEAATVQQQLQSSGFNAEQVALDANQAAQLKLKTDFQAQLDTETSKPGTSTTIQVNRRQSSEQINFNKQMQTLQDQATMLTTQMNQKMAIVNMMVTAIGHDNTNAQVAYQDAFNNAVQIQQLITAKQATANTVKQQSVNNAQANLTVLTNLITSGQLKTSSLTATQKASIADMETTAGLPAGFVESVTKTLKDPITSFLPAYDNAQGQRIQPVGTIGPDGTFKVTNINQGAELNANTKPKPTKTTPAPKPQEIIATVAGNLKGVAGSDGYISPSDYKDARSQWVSSGRSAASFKTNFGSFINPSDKNSYN